MFLETPERSWSIGDRQILARSEYNEAAQAAVLLSGKPSRGVFVFVATRQPGIGLPLDAR